MAARALPVVTKFIQVCWGSCALDFSISTISPLCNWVRNGTWRPLTLAPTYMSNAIHLVLAEDLYPERLPGDEPEELEVVPWQLDHLHELVLREDCSEARSIAALFIVREVIRQRALLFEPSAAVATA